ncbi:DUF4097 family beta strand repeat-containing protein [Constantimarinum furrinae]|uniref:Adhesin domain-containing protein n=1 Tax=Constantimarinum furrinae TaxID=2562285 RepID=A0A7G8PX12_9FLAO|nr:hypothetical protein [Constantimarinum furrinae]QNJ98878.1 hypothetical protein ALE3EI_2338 [Constantimarinum furrinae]
MKLLFNQLILILLFPALMSAGNNNSKGKYTKEKTIKKEFSVNANAGLKVDNSYGNLDIVTWNENRTVIEVHIETNGDDEELVQKKLDEITVEFSANASLVSAKTLFGDKGKSWSFWGKKGNNVSMKINYTIKMPITNSVDLENDYGAISLNKLEGNAKINCDYGKLIIGQLMAENNYLNFDYTSKSTIDYMKSGKIDADYSGFRLEKVEKLELNADYTNSEIIEVSDINYNSDYGKIEVGKAGKVVGNGDYVTHRLGTITGSLNLNSDYGSISIDRVSNGAKDVTIRSQYTGIKLGFDSSLSFDFYARVTYANLNGEDTINITKTDKDITEKTYEGYHGTKGSGTKFNINSSYGGITLKKM